MYEQLNMFNVEYVHVSIEHPGNNENTNIIYDLTGMTFEIKCIS